MVGTKSAQAIEDMVAVSNIFWLQKSFFLYGLHCRA